MNVDEIKELMEKGKIEIGTKFVLKNADKGKIEKVILSNNLPENLKNKVKEKCIKNKIEITEANLSGMKLGHSCGKAFICSVLSVLRSD
ncbi:MAG: ribosomal L7Ae/L30e/S12e/Gadd45 family protein [archaeon]